MKNFQVYLHFFFFFSFLLFYLFIYKFIYFDFQPKRFFWLKFFLVEKVQPPPKKFTPVPLLGLSSLFF